MMGNPVNIGWYGVMRVDQFDVASFEFVLSGGNVYCVSVDMCSFVKNVCSPVTSITQSAR